MNITRHISIGEEYFDRIKPFIEKHNGNLGAVLREIINQVEVNNSNTNIDRSLSDWIFKEAEGRLVPDSIIDKMIDPNLINSMKKLDAHLNDIFSKSELHININLESDKDISPSFILVDIRGSPPKIKFVAGILSKYLIRNSSERSPLGIDTVTTFDESIRIEFCMMDKDQSIKSLSTFFGYSDEILNTIRDKPTFWKDIIERHITSNYNMVTIHKNHFEELLADDVSMIGDITIEFLTKKAIQDIPLKELLYLIKNVYENSRIVDRIDIDKEDLVLYHSYRNQKAVIKLKNILVTLLENSGHFYDATSTSNSIILRYRPDLDVKNLTKIEKIINNLKTNSNEIDQELTRFIICLNGLKDMPDISLSLTLLGRKIGKYLIQEYEKENNYHDWDMEKFIQFIQLIDSKLHRISTWKSESGNTSYIINKCYISKNEDIIDQYMCRTMREMFKGALNYAFGDNANIEVQKLLSHGDNSCEVIIRTKQQTK